MGTDSFTSIAKGTFLIIKTRSCDENLKNVYYCNDSDLTAHTLSPSHSRPIKVSIHHLYHTIPVEDIVTASPSQVC
jgi:hypothetical protein